MNFPVQNEIPMNPLYYERTIKFGNLLLIPLMILLAIFFQ